MDGFVRKRTCSVTYSSMKVRLHLRKKNPPPTFPFHCFHKCWDHGTYKPHSHAAGQLPPLSFTVLKNVGPQHLIQPTHEAPGPGLQSEAGVHWNFRKRHLSTVTGLRKPCGCDQVEADIYNEHRRSCGAVHSHASKNPRLSLPPFEDVNTGKVRPIWLV